MSKKNFSPVRVAVSVIGEHEGPATFSVSDAVGRAVFTTARTIGPGVNAVHLDLSTVPTGVYLLTIEANGRTTTTRIVRSTL